MKYWDWQEVRFGDKVKLSDARGVVVCSIDTGEYSEEYPESEWSYLGRGVMIKFDLFGLFHYEEPEEDLIFIGRIE